MHNLEPQPSSTSTIIIETHQLNKKFATTNVLNDINITIKQGEFVAIMGSSGSGKTTLLNILSLLDQPSSGKLYLNGTDTSAFDAEQRRIFAINNIGLIFQQFHLIPYLSALENVMLAQYYHSIVDEAGARATLAAVGLEHRTSHLPNQLSGGEQQRVCIARALVNQPAIIFADEPTGNLDEINEKVVLNIFLTLHKAGKTIIMVTHNPELGQLTDRIINLHHGSIS